ncbi:hypothetical protein BC833DRAFT_597401 [Globomyces pollinis-pini]|nr:hypothetical protein BC833DRAFT_597401 [Globomyces pollinis-pini]
MAPINVKIKCSNESAFSISIDSEAKVLELKEAITTHFKDTSPTAPTDQRLIFAGKVLKDEESLAVYKLSEGNTVHLVRANKPKAAAPAPAAAASTPAVSSTPAAAAPPVNPFNMFGQSPQGGFPSMGAGMPMGGGMPMGAGMPNPAQMMNDPMFATMMSQMLSNPQMLDMMIASNPQLAGMITPEIRQQMRDPQFQQMMSNPQVIQQMLQMQQMMGGMGGMGGMGAGANPLANMYGQNPALGGGFANPYADNAATSPPAAGAGTAPNPAANPMFNPAMMQMLMGARGAGAAATTPSQPPEILYQTQLAQLQDMGFFNPTENIRALQMTGGNVEAAVEWLFSHPAGQI